MGDGIVTQALDQLARVTAISPEALTAIQEPNGPLQAIELKRLLGRLIQTDAVKVLRADLIADLAHDANTVALVYADPVGDNNGWYRKVGGNGTGNWSQFEILTKFARESVATLSGDGPPAAEIGAIGQFYRDTSSDAQLEYGPKTELGWGAPRSLVGNPGGSNNTYTDLADVALKIVPAGTNLIFTNDGRQLVRSPLATPAYVAANPTSSVLDKSNAGFLSPVTQAAVIGFSHLAIAGALASPELLGNTVAIRLSKELMITDFGAIGDGTSHPVSEWLHGGARDRGYANLEAIQCDYPDVRTLTDEIDYAAINKTIRRAYEIGYGVYAPPGNYLGWAYVRSNNMSIRGQSSATCKFTLPAGATHSVPNNNDGTGAMVTGVPCVIDLNNIGYGNTAPPISGFLVSGLTLDGNRTGTTVPTHDLFGWGLTGTRASDVVIDDVISQNAHCGGIGRFINSDRWTIQATIKYCGLSTVDGSQRPGIDTNSSSWGTYNVVAIGCPYGSRLLDNCRFNSGTIRAQNCLIIGFLLYDQEVNNGSLYNDFTVFVEGGCAAQGVQIGIKARSNSIRAYVNGITGQPWYTVAATNPQNSPRDNSFRLYSTANGIGALREDGNNNTWEEIVTDGDGVGLSQGAAYAVDVYGSDNIFRRVTYRPTSPWTLRGIAFRSGAKHNIVSNCPTNQFPANPWDDTDGTNRLILTRSTPQATGNVTLSAEWGAAAVVTAISGNDLGGSIWVTAAGAGRAANPSITIAWADGYVPAGKYTLIIDTLGGNGFGGATDSRQVLNDRFSFRYLGKVADSGVPADGGSYLFTWSLM